MPYLDSHQWQNISEFQNENDGLYGFQIVTTAFLGQAYAMSSSVPVQDHATAVRNLIVRSDRQIEIY